MRHLFLWSALLVGLAVALLGAPGLAAESDNVDKLIKQLGSSRFAVRESAQKRLLEIGQPAVEALKKAAESGDMETKRRALDLLTTLEKQAQGNKVLAATRVKLSYKDTPLKEALADFGKKTGYQFSLVDPQNKLAAKKITLEIAETTFWEALEQFCEKTGLVEAEEAVGQPQPYVEDGTSNTIILPNIQIQPPAPPPAPPIQIQKQPLKKLPVQKAAPAKKPVPQKEAPAPKAAPADNKAPMPGFAFQAQDNEKEEAAKREKEKAAAIQREEIAKKQAAAAEAAKQAAAQAAQQAALQRAIILQRAGAVRRRGFREQIPVQPTINPTQIVLKEGKPSADPTSYSGAVRIRSTNNVAQFANGFDKEKEILTGLKISPEPKIRWQSLVNVRIDKAIDDQDQNLMPKMGGEAVVPNPYGEQIFPGGGRIIIGGAMPPGGWGFGGGYPVQQQQGPHQYVPVRLKIAEKPSKMLKELTGVVTANVLAEAETHITADNILKAAGKTFKGKDGGSIKVTSVTEANGYVTIRFEFDAPKDVIPAQAAPVQPAINGPGVGGGLQIMPALPQANAMQVKLQVAQVQQIQIIGGGFGGPAFNGGAQGLELLDDKGRVVACVGSSQEVQGGPGGFQVTQAMSFQLGKDQKADKLVFKGSKSVPVDIPFTLKNVKLP